MRPLVSKLVKPSGRVAGLVGGSLPDLKLFLRQLVPVLPDRRDRFRRLCLAHPELVLEFRHSDLKPHRRVKGGTCHRKVSGGEFCQVCLAVLTDTREDENA